MSNETKETDPKEMVPIVLDLPAGLVSDFDKLVESGIYPDRASALLHGLVESWRHNEGTHHRVRVEIATAPKAQEDEAEMAPDAPAVARASDDQEPIA